MTDAADMIEHVSIRYLSRLKKICEPLYRYFGINHFFVSKTSATGRFYTIGSHPKMLEYYFFKKCYIHSPLHKNPKFIQPGFYYYRHFKNQHFQHAIDSIGEQTAVELIAGISVKKNGDLIRFGYGALPQDAHHVLPLLCDNLELLKKFNSYFMSEIQDLLVKAEAHSLDMTKEMGSFYNQPIEELKHRLNCQDKIVFLKHLGLINNSAAFDLTDRELSCLHYLAKGFSCQQIARSIFLSARTVEHYIEILKEKFNCLRKTDLIDIAHLIHED